MGRAADRTRVKASDEDILAAYLRNPKGGVKAAAVATRTPWPLAGRALNRMGVVSDPRSMSGRERVDEDALNWLNSVTNEQWHFLAGVFFGQKTGISISGKTVRLNMTISDRERLAEVAKILGVGEVNMAATNGGKNIQFTYRTAQRSTVRRMLEEFKARTPGRHPGIEKGLAALDELDRYGRDDNDAE